MSEDLGRRIDYANGKLDEGLKILQEIQAKMNLLVGQSKQERIAPSYNEKLVKPKRGKPKLYYLDVTNNCKTPIGLLETYAKENDFLLIPMTDLPEQQVHPFYLFVFAGASRISPDQIVPRFRQTKVACPEATIVSWRNGNRSAPVEIKDEGDKDDCSKSLPIITINFGLDRFYQESLPRVHNLFK